MAIRPAALVQLTGQVDRARYFVLGVTLASVKFALDWLVAYLIFDRTWTVYNYLVLPAQTVRVWTLPDADRLFFGTLLLLALPFIWVGTALTVQRLQAAGLPIGLVLFFFTPVVNLLFFIVLSVLPSRPSETMTVESAPDRDNQDRPEQAIQDSGRIRAFKLMRGRKVASLSSDFAAHQRITHGNPWPSAGVALAISVPVALGFVVFSVHGLHNYGWGLFVGMPFCLGLGSVLLYGLARPQGLANCIMVAFLAASLVGAGMLLLFLEGFICLLMAAPIGYFLALLGALVGYAIQSRPWSSRESPFLMLALFLTLPGLMAAETAAAPEPPLLEVCTTLEIDAPPEQVWEHVLSFSPLPEPEDWLFRAGIAYPVQADIHGQGPGAIRHCVFSTGTFVEPIEVWQPPRLLRFWVTDQPPPMVEWSPYDIHPPHLDHYLVSRRGQFLLVPLPDRRTRLEGTTWYTNRMWPETYWQLWSDHIIHRIHLRVLRHIKQQAENTGG